MKLRQAKKLLKKTPFILGYYSPIPNHWRNRTFYRSYLRLHKQAIKAFEKIPKIPGMPPMWWDYDLRTGFPVPSTMFNHIWFQDYMGHRVLKQEAIGDVKVSTVNMGIDMKMLSYNIGRIPTIFETMVFGGSHDGEQARYQTRAQALNGHSDYVNMIKHEQEQDTAHVNELIGGVDVV